MISSSEPLVRLENSVIMIDVVVATVDVAEKSATAPWSVLENVPEVPKPEMVNVQATKSSPLIGPRAPSVVIVPDRVYPC